MAIRKQPDFARKSEFVVSEAAKREHEKKKNRNPIFGFGGDPNFLPDEVRYWLVVHASKSGLDPAQQEKLVAYANQFAQMPVGGDEPIATQRAEIEKVASEARRLLASLNALSEPTIATMAVYAREACFERPSPIPADMSERITTLDPTGFMEQAWQWANALEIIAEHANSQQMASRQDKPKQARARAMVASLAGCYMQMTDKAPPADPAAWFTDFAGRLGEHLGLNVGPRIVKSGIDEARR